MTVNYYILPQNITMNKVTHQIIKLIETILVNNPTSNVPLGYPVGSLYAADAKKIICALFHIKSIG